MKDVKIQVEDLSLYYGEKKALNEISLQIPANKVTALIGPSGCGKSTFLRCINRMNDLIPGVKITGKMLVEGVDIYDKDVDVVTIRKKIGMVFQNQILFRSLFMKMSRMVLKLMALKTRRSWTKLLRFPCERLQFGRN